MNTKHKLEDLYHKQKINRLEGEILCWMIHIIENKLTGSRLDLFDNSIKENEDKLLELKGEC